MWYRCNPEEYPCGECDACCKVFHIEELDKPQFVPCKHLGKTVACGACTIYEDRPHVCRTYQCAYLAAHEDPFLSDYLPYFLEKEFRPNTLGIVFDRGYPLPGDIELIEGTEVWPDAHKSANAMRLIEGLASINPVLVELVQPSSTPEIMEPYAYHWYIKVPEYDEMVVKVHSAVKRMVKEDPDTPPIYLTTFSDFGQETTRLT